MLHKFVVNTPEMEELIDDAEAAKAVIDNVDRAAKYLKRESDHYAYPEERRKELERLVGRKVEEAHVAVRNIRRDSLEQFRGMERSKELSQDESRRSQEQLQALTDGVIGQMDSLREVKEAEVMEV